MQQAEVADVHQAIGQDGLEEPAEKLHDVKVSGAEAGTAHFPGGEGDHAIREADETVGGESDLEDRGGKGSEGGVAVVVGPTMDVPGDGPGLRINLLQQTSVAHVFFEERTGDGGERFHRDKEVGAGRAPGRAVLGEATARDDRVDVGMVLELPAPGVQNPGEPREVCPNAALVCGEPCEGERRGAEHGVVRKALMGPDEGSERLRNGAGEEEVRSGKLFFQMLVEPLVGFMLLTRGTVAVATGMLDAVLPPPVLALREAMAVMSAAAVLDGAHDLAVREGKVGRTLQVLWRTGGADLAESGHGRSPCMRECRRA
jgi:hypothetical protein